VLKYESGLARTRTATNSDPLPTIDNQINLLYDLARRPFDRCQQFISSIKAIRVTRTDMKQRHP